MHYKLVVDDRPHTLNTTRRQDLLQTTLIIGQGVTLSEKETKRKLYLIIRGTSCARKSCSNASLQIELRQSLYSEHLVIYLKERAYQSFCE